MLPQGWVVEGCEGGKVEGREFWEGRGRVCMDSRCLVTTALLSALGTSVTSLEVYLDVNLLVEVEASVLNSTLAHGRDPDSPVLVLDQLTDL